MRSKREPQKRSGDAIKAGRDHGGRQEAGLGLGVMNQLHQAGDVAGSRVLVDDAFRGDVADHLDGSLQVALGGVEVAFTDGFAYFFDGCTHGGFPVAIARTALDVLTQSFQGRLAVGHVLASPILFFSRPCKRGLWGSVFSFFVR